MGMLHGGVRYMATEPEVTKLSCIESGIIQRLAPHLIFRIPWIMPLFAGGTAALKGFASAIAQYDELGKFKNSKSHVVLSAEEARALEPSLSPNIEGAVTMDEPGVDVFRLVIANVISAAEHGADIRTHARATAILRDDNQVYGVQITDTLTGEVEEYHATYVVNAAGPWTPQVATLARVPFKLRPTKGIHIIFDRRITSTAVSGAGASLLPHENTSICGLTDKFFFLDPDEVRSSREEVEYLLSAMEKAIPSIREARVIRTMAGVRPLLDQPGTDERKLTRHYKVHDHEELDGVRGFLTIAGGKMVIYRIMAEDMTNLICQKLGRAEPCRTKEEPLPGGEEQVDPAALADGFGVPLHTVTRIVYRHGSRATRILEMCREEPQYKSHVCVCEPVTEAEIRYAITREWARTLDDLRRRTRLGMGPCQGCHCTKVAAGVLVDERDEPAKRGHQEVSDFLQERWKGREPVLVGTQLRQEELLRACYVGVGGYHNPALEKVSQR